MKRRLSLTTLLVGAILIAAPSALALEPPKDKEMREAMKNMMKALDQSAARGDGRATSILLETIGVMSAPEYTEWKEISKKGAKAARRGDMANVKASCKSCHDKYQEQFKAKYGSGSSGAKPIPVPVD